MGATDFSAVAFGKTAEEAYHKAVDEALYERGHGGYTGTIAEKSGFHLFEPPKGLTYARAMKLIEEFTTRTYKIEGMEWAHDQAKAKREAKAARKWMEKLDPTLRSWLVKCHNVSEDKWGPAAAIKITGKEAQELRKREGMQRKKGDFYLFWGLASC